MVAVGVVVAVAVGVAVDTMTDFSKYLVEQGLSKSSAELYLSCVEIAISLGGARDVFSDDRLSPSRKDTFRKALLHWARFKKDEDLLDFLKEVKIPGRWARQKKIVALSMDEWRALQVEVKKPKVGSRVLRATLTLLCTSGMRISEVLNLSRSVLEAALEEGRAKTPQKGGFDRWYIIASEDQWEASSTLFDAMSSTRNRVWKVNDHRGKGKPAVARQVRAKLKKAAKDANILTKNVNPHMLRRTAGDAVRIASGGDMKVVQDFLGHRSLKTTLLWYQDHSHPEEVEEALGKALI